MDCYSFRERKPRVTTAVAVVGFCYGRMWFSQVIGMDKESTPFLWITDGWRNMGLSVQVPFWERRKEVSIVLPQ